MRYFVFFLSISLIAIPGFLQAQSFTFLPENSFRISYENRKIQRSGIFVKKNTRTSMLSYELDRDKNLQSNSVDGSINFETFENKLVFQIGLTPSINFGIEFPQIKKRRIADLAVRNISDTHASTFVSSRQSIEQSGMGDRNLWLLWRLVYNDLHDFQMGLNYKDNNGAFSLDEKDELSLGSGSREATPFLRWIYYPQSSHLAVIMEFLPTFMENTKVMDSSGDEVEMKRGNEFEASVNVWGQSGIFNLGAEIKAQAVRPLFVDDIDQNNGYLRYSYRFNVNLGNVYLLEKQSLLFPWEVDLYMKNTFWGVNAPGDEEVGIYLSLYF